MNDFPFRLLRAVYNRFLRLVRRGSELRFKMLHSFYYWFLFGRKGFLATRLSEMVSTYEREGSKRDIPASKDAWDAQYLRGDWAYMTRPEEAARYGAIVGYLQSLKQGGSILDVGCGEGVLQARLRPHDYTSYVGVDISETAIASASQRADAHTGFIEADAATYTPTGTFDAIVFNESLYYFSEPIAVFERYTRYLKPDGILITSFHKRSHRANSIRRQLKARYPTVSEVTTATKFHSWTCTVFQGEKSHGRTK